MRVIVDGIKHLSMRRGPAERRQREPAAAADQA